MSGAAAEGKAGICSLFVAWPSRFTGQYGREAHLTQNNILRDGQTQTSSQPSLWLKLLAFTNSLSSFLSGCAGSYFQKCFCDWGGGKKRGKMPNLAVVDPKREAEFIPVVSKYWPMASHLTSWNLGFSVTRQGFQCSLSLLLQHCCFWQQSRNPNKNINSQTCGLWWIVIKCPDLFALFSRMYFMSLASSMWKWCLIIATIK